MQLIYATIQQLGVSNRGRPIIDIGHFQNIFADNFFFIFYFFLNV